MYTCRILYNRTFCNVFFCGGWAGSFYLFCAFFIKRKLLHLLFSWFVLVILYIMFGSYVGHCGHTVLTFVCWTYFKLCSSQYVKLFTFDVNKYIFSYIIFDATTYTCLGFKNIATIDMIIIILMIKVE